NYDAGWDAYVGSSGVSVQIEDSSGFAESSTIAVSGLDDGKWHHLMGSYDRSADATVYTDGIARGTMDISSVTLSLTNGQHLFVGAGSLGGIADGTGSLRDVAIWNSALTAANALSLATNPLNATAAVSIPAWWWKMDEAWTVQVADSGSVTGADVLAVNGTITRTQQAYISKNLIADGNMENGGIGAYINGLVAGTNPLQKTSASAFKDAQGISLTTYGIWQNFQTSSATVAAGENYVVRYWWKPASSTIQQYPHLICGTHSITWYGQSVQPFHTDYRFFEGSFEAPALAVDAFMRFTLGAATSSVGDDFKLLRNYVVNGGMDGGADPPDGWIETGSITATSYDGYYPYPYPYRNAHSGTYCVKLVSGAAGQYIYRVLAGLVSDTYYEVSCWAKGDAGGESFSLGVFSGGASASSGTYTLSAGSTAWQRISFTFKTGTVTGAESIQCYMAVDAQTIYVDDVSVVHRPDLSPTLTAMSTNYRYEPTRLGMGYHTGGNEHMVYAITGNKDQSAGRIVFRPQFPSTTGTTQYLLEAINTGNNVISVQYSQGLNKFAILKVASGAAYMSYSVEQNFSANDEIELGWYTDPTSGTEVFVNGSASGSTGHANTTPLATNPSTLYIGSDATFTMTNIIIDDLEILTKSMPAEWFAEQHTKRLAS
ncbi:MAG TPA: hypothetical protein EYO58_08155, partial [Flavobacteriales bacterium]|nr:hypothetical protein [Flavobacteriales bacterium]